MKDKVFIIMGAPLSSFPLAPKEQAGCELEDCTHCGKQMWISAKKRLIRSELPKASSVCYDCLQAKVKLEPGFFMDTIAMRI